MSPPAPGMAPMKVPIRPPEMICGQMDMMVPEIRAGLEKKDPKFLDDFDISFPLASWAEVERIKAAGLDENYNEFCRDRKIKSHYGVYFFNEKPKEN